MRHLPSQVEDGIDARYQRLQPCPVAQVELVDLETRRCPSEVFTVPAMRREERVDNSDLGAKTVQRQGDVRSDKAEPPGDDDLAAGIVVVQHGGLIPSRIP